MMAESRPIRRYQNGERITRDSDGAKGTLYPTVSTAPADCTLRCKDGDCDCSGAWRVLRWGVEWDATNEGEREQ